MSVVPPRRRETAFTAVALIAGAIVRGGASPTATPTAAPTVEIQTLNATCAAFGDSFLLEVPIEKCSGGGAVAALTDALVAGCGFSGVTLSCAVGGGRGLLAHDEATCDAAASALNAAVAEVTGPVGSTTFVADPSIGCTFGILTVPPSTCQDVAAALNSLVRLRSRGEFLDCIRTTPTTTATQRSTTTPTTTATTTISTSRTTTESFTVTTTATSTVTTTATSTVTTTPIHGRWQCDTVGTEDIIVLASTTDCTAQLRELNSLHEACSGRSASVGRAECHSIPAVSDAAVRVPISGGLDDDCDRTALSLNAAIDAITAGTVQGALQCLGGGVLGHNSSAATSCDVSVAALNSAVRSRADGTFETCALTTPTTTATTTATVTLMLTTATTSVTTTPTATTTTSPTSTATSSATTSVTSSPLHGQLECRVYNGVSYLTASGGIRTEGSQASLVQRLIEVCSVNTGLQPTISFAPVNAIFSGLAVPGANASHGSSVATSLNRAIAEFSRGQAVGAARFSVVSALLDGGDDGALCTSMTVALNAALRATADGTFEACERTTPTTSATSTPTSTPTSTASSTATTTLTTSSTTSATSTQTSTVSTTINTTRTTTATSTPSTSETSSETTTITSTATSTPTTTALDGHWRCVTVSSVASQIAALGDSRDCEGQIRELNALHDACIEAGAGLPGQIQCHVTQAAVAARVPVTSSVAPNCDDTATTLNAAIEAFSFGSVVGALHCVGGGILAINDTAPFSSCRTTAATLNAAIRANAERRFSCSATSPTTTPTTTTTTTPTTTATTTAIHGRLVCDDDGFLGIAAAVESCGLEAFRLTGFAEACGTQSLSAFECGERTNSSAEDHFFPLFTNDTECSIFGGSSLSRALASAILAFHGRSVLVTCVPLALAAAETEHAIFAGADTCGTTATLINTAYDSFVSAGSDFSDCSLSTPTSTATSSATSTQTTTPTHGKFECNNIGTSFAAIVLPGSVDQCENEVRRFQQLLRECNPLVSSELACGNLTLAFSTSGTPYHPLITTNATDCQHGSGIPQALSTILRAFGGSDASVACTNLVPGLGPFVFTAIDRCTRVATTLNEALDAFTYDGTFDDCSLSTPTTTGTSSQTSTPTSTTSTTVTTTITTTATTTAQLGQLECVSYSGDIFLALETVADTAVQARQLNLLVAACSNIARDDLLAVAEVNANLPGVAAPLANSSQGVLLARAMNAAVSQFSRGEVSAAVQFVHLSGFFTYEGSLSACAEASRVLNEAVRATVDGTFRECLLSTPTTTVSTSQTTSVTSTATSSGTSSATSSQTTSATTSGTYTETSTRTSSGTTTGTTSETSTPTTTATSSPTSSVTLSASTTRTSSATSSQTTSLTTTESSTATTTATSSPTSTVTTTSIRGRFECFEHASGIVYIGIQNANECAVQTNILSELQHACGLSNRSVDCVQAVTIDGSTFHALSRAGSPCWADDMNTIASRFAFGVTTTSVCAAFTFLADTDIHACSLTAGVFNRVIADFVPSGGEPGRFANCDVTSPTTTPTTTTSTTQTSTATSTATSSATTTSTIGALRCIPFSVGAAVTVHRSANVTRHVNGLNDLLLGCTAQLAPTDRLTLRPVGSTTHALQTISGEVSPDLNDAVQRVSREFTEGSSTASRLGTNPAGFLVAASLGECESSLVVLNTAVGSTLDGGFASCRFTTVTSTATTTATTLSPTAIPTNRPSVRPTNSPSRIPTILPTEEPTSAPSSAPSTLPTFTPTFPPTVSPIHLPTPLPTASPSVQPTAPPTESPSAVPSVAPTAVPSKVPTPTPTGVPTLIPTSAQPTPLPTAVPSATPTFAPTHPPTDTPSTQPTHTPTTRPSGGPTAIPTAAPTTSPTVSPSEVPSFAPTSDPTNAPTNEPSASPTTVPTSSPTDVPTEGPSPSTTTPVPLLPGNDIRVLNSTVVFVLSASVTDMTDAYIDGTFKPGVKVLLCSFGLRSNQPFRLLHGSACEDRLQVSVIVAAAGTLQRSLRRRQVIDTSVSVRFFVMEGSDVVAGTVVADAANRSPTSNTSALLDFSLVSAFTDASTVATTPAPPSTDTSDSTGPFKGNNVYYWIAAVGVLILATIAAIVSTASTGRNGDHHIKAPVTTKDKKTPEPSLNKSFADDEWEGIIQRLREDVADEENPPPVTHFYVNKALLPAGSNDPDRPAAARVLLHGDAKRGGSGAAKPAVTWDKSLTVDMEDMQGQRQHTALTAAKGGAGAGRHSRRSFTPKPTYAAPAVFDAALTRSDQNHGPMAFDQKAFESKYADPVPYPQTRRHYHPPTSFHGRPAVYGHAYSIKPTSRSTKGLTRPGVPKQGKVNKREVQDRSLRVLAAQFPSVVDEDVDRVFWQVAPP